VHGTETTASQILAATHLTENYPFGGEHTFGLEGPMIITVVTPSLNGMRYLPECIESTKRQESSRFEVEHIIVDGGSTDGTPEYAASRGCKVMYRDGGISEALNIGFYSAGGLLVGMLGCDDFLLPGALDGIVDEYERSRRRWIVGGCRWLDARGRDIGTFRSPPKWLTAPMLASLRWSCIPGTSTYVHKDLFADLNGFNTAFAYGGDYDFFARALERERFSRIAQVVSCCYRHGENISMRRDDIYHTETKMIADRYAPATWLRRRAYRLVVQSWLNATNPRWLTMKMVHRTLRPVGTRARGRFRSARRDSVRTRRLG
jgi:glycosyltransferase involved in cell wall biosynthesis